jgi:glucose 1-dehydrogenase
MSSSQIRDQHKGKVAIITHACKGIGKAIALKFAKAGYTMMINDISEQDLNQTAREILFSLPQNTGTERNANNHVSNYVSCFPGDVSKEEVSMSLMEETIKRFGRIDTLINNATVSQQSIASQSYEMSAATATSANPDTNVSANYQKGGQSSPFFTLEEYEIMDTSLKGVYFCIRELVKQLLVFKNLNSDGTISRHDGKNDIDSIGKVECSIINIASCHNSIPSSQADAYSFSQSGIDPFTSSRSSIKSLTESVALQLADKGISVNAIAPGIIDSDVNNEFFEDKEKMRQVEHIIPFQRIGQAQEIAEVALFLASKASSYVTGTMIYTDGGLSLLNSRSA